MQSDTASSLARLNLRCGDATGGSAPSAAPLTNYISIISFLLRRAARRSQPLMCSCCVPDIILRRAIELSESRNLIRLPTENFLKQPTRRRSYSGTFKFLRFNPPASTSYLSPRATAWDNPDCNGVHGFHDATWRFARSDRRYQPGCAIPAGRWLPENSCNTR